MNTNFHGAFWLVAALCFGGWGGALAQASPILSIDAAGTTATSESIPFGTAAMSVDVHLNTGGNAVSGLQYYLQSSGPAVVHYGATPLTITGYDKPFVVSDEFLTPTPGAGRHERIERHDGVLQKQRGRLRGLCQ